MPAAAPTPNDLPRTIFAVLALALLIVVSMWVLRPFIGPLLWATMIVVATWPLLLRIQGWLGGRRALAVTVMTLLLLLLFVVPLVMAILTLVQNADQIADWARQLTGLRFSTTPPDWLLGLPMVGSMLGRLWEQVLALGLDGLLQRLTPYAGDLTKWFVAEIGNAGVLVLQFLMTVVIAAILYATGEMAASQTHRFAQRLAGERGLSTIKLAGDAIRGVAIGVGATAVIQALLGGLVLAIVDVPLASLLTAFMFMLCLAQIGVIPVLVPVAIWVFAEGQIGAGIFVVVATAFIATIDNILRPMLMRLGADLPFLLTFAGVIGGMLAFGLVGIFVGPVVLAVAYMLLESWIAEPPPR